MQKYTILVHLNLAWNLVDQLIKFQIERFALNSLETWSIQLIRIPFPHLYDWILANSDSNITTYLYFENIQ